MKISRSEKMATTIQQELDLQKRDNVKETLQVFPGARIYETNHTKKFRERKVWKSPDIQEIKSIIPGVVISLNVAEGDFVTEGTQVMTFEAMKMHNIVLAPIDGTVKKIYVQEGQKVPKGDIMIYIKASQDIEDNSDSTDVQEYVNDPEDTITDGDLGLIV